MSVLLEHWDFDKQQPATNCPDGAEIQFQITSKIREYEKKIKKLEVLEIPVTFDNLFEQNGKRINCTVGDYFKQIIDRLEKVEKYGSASKHKVTLALMQQFKSTNMRFEELDLTYLREFEIFLRQRGNVNNSLATKFSVLKAVYNKAVSEGVFVPKSNPFQLFKVGSLWTNTRKRAITKEDIRKLIELDLTDRDYYTQLAKDIGLHAPLTTYVARHTYATVLKRSGVSVALISESLGHSDLSTTQIYLDSFENSQIDAAMQHLL